MIQDQDKASSTHRQWNKTGVVVDIGPYDAYQVRVDGSRHITKRNRQYLKPLHVRSDVFVPTKPNSSPITPKNWTQKIPDVFTTNEKTEPPTDQVLPTPQTTSDKIPPIIPDEEISAPETLQPIPKVKLRRDKNDGWTVSSPVLSAVSTPVRENGSYPVHAVWPYSPCYIVHRQPSLSGVKPVSCALTDATSAPPLPNPLPPCSHQIPSCSSLATMMHQPQSLSI